MSKGINSFTFWLRVGIVWVGVLIAGFGTLYYLQNSKYEEELAQYQVKANACAAGISKALAAIKGKGYGSYPDAEPGTRAYDVHYAYYRRFSDLDRLRSAVQQERDPGSFAFRLNEDECKAVAAGEDIRIEPTVIEKSEPRPLTYEESVAKAHEDAARANAQIDRAMDNMLENYRKKAVSSKTHASGGSRADIFEMPDGTIVACRTTFKNGYRATTCD